MLYNALMDEEKLNKTEDSIDSATAEMEASVLVLIAEQLANITTETTFGQIAINSFNVEKQAQRILDRQRITMEKMVSKEFAKMAKATEKWAEPYFQYRGKDILEYKETAIVRNIVTNYLDDVFLDMQFLTDIKVMGVVQNGKMVSLRNAYINAATDAAASLRAGQDAYKLSVSRSVSELAKSGLKTVAQPTIKDIPKVVYSTGNVRNLRSAMSMNIWDSYTHAMQEYRDELGKEFGADGYIISAHALCAKDHLEIQGSVWKKEAWERKNASLDRPIGTMNCKHSADPCIYDIAQSPYNKAQLAQLRRNSTEKISFTGIGGKTLTKSRYDASQYLRSVETKVRDQRTLAAMQKAAGVDSSAARKAARDLTNDYKGICKATGLKARPERMRAIL